MDAGADSEAPRFLPPEPAGPEPELGDRPAPPQPPPQYQPPQAAPAPAPYGQTYGYPPPPPGYWQPQQPQPPQPWQYAQYPPAPDNGQAITGFVFSLVGLSLLFMSAGLSSIISLGCSITGIVCSRNGKKKVDRGESPKHRGLAQAGFVIGWVGLVLAVLATIFWVIALIAGILDETTGDPGGSGQTVTAALGG